MKFSIVYSIAAIVISVLVTVLSTIFSWSFYLPSTLIVLFIVGALFVNFERRKVDAKEIAIISILCALAVISRAAFIGVPFFKPTAAIIVIGALAFGPRVGSFCGACAILASNMLFGQGMWTPWQMLAFASVGLFFGLLGCAKPFAKRPLSLKKLILLSILSFLFVVLIEGPILDTYALFSFMSEINFKSVLTIYLAGVVPNILQGIATLITTLLLANPILRILERVKQKYV